MKTVISLAGKRKEKEKEREEKQQVFEQKLKNEMQMAKRVKRVELIQVTSDGSSYGYDKLYCG